MTQSVAIRECYTFIIAALAIKVEHCMDIKCLRHVHVAVWEIMPQQVETPRSPPLHSPRIMHGFSMELTITNIVIFSPHSFSSLLNFNKLSIVKAKPRSTNVDSINL